MTLQECVEKMRAGGEKESEIDAFTRLFRAFNSLKNDSWIKEEDIEPLGKVPSIRDIVVKEANPADLASTAFIKLNGGLGTSMGLRAPKSSLPVVEKNGEVLSFLDIIIRQIQTSRRRLGITFPLIFLDSLHTSSPTLQEAEKLGFSNPGGIPMELMQNREPKILPDGSPASWAQDPSLEWCPMGHGDIFNVLYTSGLLDLLLEKGIKYLFISNCDNLGARPSTKIASYFASLPASFMMEVARRTPSDVKGGQIVRDKFSGRLVLREMSQVSPEDMKFATDISRHMYFNTNNLWIKVEALKERLEEVKGDFDFPIIVNKKTVDPSDPGSLSVVQLETAMGSIISQFRASACLEVDRPRFLPVKTTDDLLVMRSNRFHLTNLYEMEDGDYHLPRIILDKRYYKNISDFDERLPFIPSLAAAASVKIEGDWRFGKDVSFFGNVQLKDNGKPNFVPDGSFVGDRGVEAAY
ncbi:MAG: UTP--glucose-1-phosphate uridylyltransferase [Aeriscardovia sp.]|nr:UTP--glucose-1-phosphate uridylyltransferase [Aeriscardovia sp.]